MEIDKLTTAVKSSRKTLWILCGLPYSGKTHISRRIIQDTGISYVSIDGILAERGFDWDAGKLPDADGWKEVFEMSYELTRNFLTRGMNVLYDSTNHTKASRDKLRQIAEEAEADTQVIFIDVLAEIIWKRWEENCRKKRRSIVAKELVEKTIADFEKPGSDENVFVLENA